MISTTTALLVGQILTFLAVIFVGLMTWARAERQRTWDIADRNAVAERLVIANTLIAKSIVKQNGDIAANLAAVTAHAHQQLAEMIQTIIDTQRSGQA